MTKIDEQGFVPSGSYVDLTHESSNLDEMWYFTPPDVPNPELHVKFKSGIRYRYFGVVPPLWNAILQGKLDKKGNKTSVGASFHHHVVSKPDIHPYERIEQ